MSFEGLLAQLAAEHEALQARLERVTSENNILRASLSQGVAGAAVSEADSEVDSEAINPSRRLIADEPEHAVANSDAGPSAVNSEGSAGRQGKPELTEAGLDVVEPANLLHQREFRLRLCFEIKDDDLRYMRPILYDLESAMDDMDRRQKQEKRHMRFREKLLLARERDQNFKFILHPQGDIRLCLDISSLFMLGYDCIMTPLQLLMESEPTGVFVCGWLVNGFWTLDIGASLITGFYQESHLVMRWKSIVEFYMLRWFIFDLLVILPDWIALFLKYDKDLANTLSTLRVLKMIRFLRLMRLIKLKRLIGDVFGRINSDWALSCMRLAALLGVILLAMHVLACFWFLIGDNEKGWAAYLVDSDLSTRYWISLVWSMSNLQGSTPPDSLQTGERIYVAVTMLISLALTGIFIGSTTQMLQDRTNFSQDITGQRSALRSFAQRHHTSLDLCVQIRQHLESQAIGRDTARDTRLLKLLSPGLLKDLLLEVRGATTHQHVLFDFLGTRNTMFVRQLCSEAMTNQTCQAGEVIFFAGDACKDMRFMKEGCLKYLHTSVLDKLLLDGAKPPRGMAPRAVNNRTGRTRGTYGAGTFYEREQSMERKQSISSNMLGEWEDKAQTVNAGSYLSEACLWTLWENCGLCVSNEEGMILILNTELFQETIKQYPEVHWMAVLYARQFILKLNRTPKTDLLEPPQVQEWEPEAVDVVHTEEQDLPWEEELPPHISKYVAKAVVKLSQLIASEGLDENRPHHGFTVIAGDEERLAQCGKSGFNPFQGHDLRLVTKDGKMDKEVFDTLRRNAFHSDGAICLDSRTGKVIASGWFVGDIRLGGSAGGARSRSAKAIAQQAGNCYVIKASEDSRGKVILHLGTNSMPFSGKLKEYIGEDTV